MRHTHLKFQNLHQTLTKLLRQPEPLVQLVSARALYRPSLHRPAGSHLSREPRLHCILLINKGVGEDYLARDAMVRNKP